MSVVKQAEPTPSDVICGRRGFRWDGSSVLGGMMTGGIAYIVLKDKKLAEQTANLLRPYHTANRDVFDYNIQVQLDETTDGKWQIKADSVNLREA